MPQWRKLHTKTLDSLDIAAMPDDFHRLMWAYLPLILDSEGRGIDHAGWLKSKLFPLRDDVTDKMITAAMFWYQARGMVQRYEVDGRAYFCVVSFREYQGKTDREAASVIPEPVKQAPRKPRKPVATNSGPTHELVASRSSSDVEVDVEEKREEVEGADAPPPPADPKPKAAKAPNPAAVEAFRAAANTYPNKALWQSMAEAVGDQPDDVAFWQQVVGAWIAKGYNPQNVAGMFDFFKRRELPAAGSATKTPAPVRKYDPTLSPEELALKARIKAHKEQQAQHANR